MIVDSRVTCDIVSTGGATPSSCRPIQTAYKAFRTFKMSIERSALATTHNLWSWECLLRHRVQIGCRRAFYNIWLINQYKTLLYLEMKLCGSSGKQAGDEAGCGGVAGSGLVTITRWTLLNWITGGGAPGAPDALHHSAPQWCRGGFYTRVGTCETCYIRLHQPH